MCTLHLAVNVLNFLLLDFSAVSDLEGQRLLVEVVRLAEGDVEPNAPDGHIFLRGITSMQ